MAENEFGILANRFRCILTTMKLEPHTVMPVILTCVTLHHIIRTLYRVDHQGLADYEDNNHRMYQMPGGKVKFCLPWGTTVGNYVTVAAKR